MRIYIGLSEVESRVDDTNIDLGAGGDDGFINMLPERWELGRG